MADVIEMDYHAVHTLAGQVSDDAALYVSISHGVNELRGDVSNAVVRLPVDTVGGPGKTDNSGVTDAQKQGRNFFDLVEAIILEISDACALLGSGTISGVQDMDATEEEIVHEFDFLTGSMPEDGSN